MEKRPNYVIYYLTGVIFFQKVIYFAETVKLKFFALKTYRHAYVL